MKDDSNLKQKEEVTTTCAGCGDFIEIDDQSPESLCTVCKRQLDSQHNSWKGDD